MIGDESFELPEDDKKLLRLLARGEREIASGKYFDLDAVLTEADALLADEPVLKT